VEADLLLHAKPAWRAHRLAMDFSMAEAIDRATAHQIPTHVLELRLPTSELITAFITGTAVMPWIRPGVVELHTAVDLHNMAAPTHACIITAIPIYNRRRRRILRQQPPPPARTTMQKLEAAAASGTNGQMLEDAAAVGANDEELEDAAEGRRTRPWLN
jgi:hypothetical protein